jgi:hypothetical protein
MRLNGMRQTADQTSKRERWNTRRQIYLFFQTMAKSNGYYFLLVYARPWINARPNKENNKNNQREIDEIFRAVALLKISPQFQKKKGEMIGME